MHADARLGREVVHFARTEASTEAVPVMCFAMERDAVMRSDYMELKEKKLKRLKIMS